MTMTRWEYIEASKVNGMLNYRMPGDEMQTQSVVGALNYLGSLGWELVTVSAVSGLSSTTHSFIFKRPVEV